LVGVTGITFDVEHLDATVNPDAVDWHSVDSSLSMDGSVTLAASGTAEISVGGFVSVAGGFTLTKSGTLLVATLTGASAFVGIGGSVSGFVVTPGSLGFSATAGEVDVALQSGQYGVEVKDVSGSLIGVSGITFDVEHLDATVNPDAVDWNSVDSSLTMDGSVTLAASGTAEVSAAGFVALAGSFSLTKSGTLLVATVTGASAFAGVGGSVSGFVVTPGSLGFSATVGEVDVALQSGQYGVEVKDLTASLVGVPLITLDVEHMNATVNPGAIDWNSLDSSLSMDGTITLAASGTAEAAVASFVSVAGGFTLTETGTLLVATLSGASAFVGVGGSVSGYVVTPGSLGFGATAGEVDVALQAGHYGVEVKNLSASLVGVPGITFDVEHLDATVNPDAIDWHSLDSSLTMDGTITLAASGTAEVAVASFVSVAGGFSLTKTGTLLVAKLTGASAFVGIGGSVSGFVVTPGSLGFSATVGEVDVALQDSHYGVDVKDAAGSLVGVPAITFDVEHLDATVNPDSIDWHTADSSLTMDGTVTLAASGTAEVSAAGFVALAGSFSFTENGTLLRVTLTNASAFVGIGGSVSGFAVVPGSVGISATAGTVDVALQTGHYGVEVKNLAGQLVGVPGLTFQVSGVDAVANPEGIDWHSIDSTLTMDGNTRIGASGSVALSAFGFVWAAGAFTLSDATITAGSLLAMTLSHVSALVGIGGGFSGISGSDVSAATVDTSDAIGVYATADEVDVATLVVSPTVTHLGVEVKNLSGGLTGIGGVTITVHGLDAQVDPDGFDWHGLYTTAGAPVPSFTMDGTKTVHASGTLEVAFGGFLTGSSGFDISKSTVNVGSPSLTGANLLVVTLTAPTLSIGAGSFGITLGGSGATVTIAALTPATPDGRSWTAVQSSNLGGSLTLGSFVTATVSGVAIDVNSATDASPLDWNGVDGSGITLGGTTAFSVSGTLTDLSIAGGLITGSSTFTVSESTIDVTVGGTTLTGAELLTLGLGSLNLSVGSASGPHFSITGGSLAVAALSAPMPSVGTDTRSWLGVIGAVTSASLVSGIPDLSLTVTSLTLRLNQASGAYTNGASVDATPLDWTTALDLNTNGTFGEMPDDQLTVGSIPIDLTGATFTISGTASVQLFGMITGTVAFAFQQQTVSVDVDRDGTLELPVSGTAWARGPPGPDLTNATLTTFGLSVPSGQTLTFGVGGVGFSVSAGSLALAIVTPSASAQAAGDSRSWLALNAQITAATFTGIPGLTLTVTALTVGINRASGTYTDPTTHAAVSTQPLDWTKSLDLDGDGVFGEDTTHNPGHNDQLSVAIGGGSPVAIAFTGTTALRVSGTATISFESLISGTVGFALATQTVTGTDLGGVSGLASASLTTLALTATSLFVGYGDVGFQISGGGLAIASLTPTDTNDHRSWLGLQADLSAGSLNGVPGLTFAVSSLQISTNTAGGGASPLDWTKVQTGGVAVLDANGATHTIAMTADTPLVISGDASIDVAGLLSGSAHFVISQSTVDIPSMSLTGANLLTIALSNVHFAVGTTSIGAQIGGGNLTIGLLVAASGPQRWFGLSSSGVSASLVLPGVTATIADLSVQVNEASGGATALDWALLPVNPLGPLSGDQLSAEGTLENLSIFGILSGSAHVSFARQTVDVQLSGGTILQGATLVSFSLGLGGGNTLQAGVPGFGLTVTDGTLLVAAIAPAASSDGRRWIAVQGNGLAATLTIPGITATVSSLDVSFNTGTGGASAIDWTTAVGHYDSGSSMFMASPVDVATGGGSTPVTLTSAVLSLSGHLTLSIGTFLTLAADFVLTRSNVALDLNGDGTADITTATLLTLGLSGVTGSLGVSGGPSIQLSGGSFALAAIATTDGATWTAIEGTVTSASLVGIPGLTLDASSLTLKVNTASGTYGSSHTVAAPLNWTTALDLDSNGHFGQSADQLTVGSTGINLSGALLAATGTAHLRLFDGFVDGTVSFSFQQQTVSVDVDGDGTITQAGSDGSWARGPPGPGPDLESATLTTIGIVIPVGHPLTIGAGGVGFSVASGSLSLAAISPIDTTNDTRSWLALTGQIANGTFSGITGVTLTVTSLGIDLNQASGAYTDPTNGHVFDAQPLDWTKDVGTDTGGTFTHSPVSITTPTPTGPVTQTITDTTGTFEVTGVATVDLFGIVSGTIGFAFSTKTVTNVDLGTNGTLASGTLTTIAVTASNVFVGAGGIGFQVSGGTFALAYLTDGGSRSWTAIEGSLTGGALTGIPGVTLSVGSLTVETNSATGADPIDWSTAFPGLVVTDALGGSHPIDISGDLSLSVSGTGATVDLFGLVSGTTDFSLTKSTVTGTNLGGVAGLSSATLTTIGLSNASITLGTSDVGFSVTGGSLTVAILSPAVTTDARRWTAISATLGSASLNGIPGVTLSATGLEIDVNQASTGATPLDWTQVPGAPVSFSGPLLEIAGTADIAIGSFVFVHGSFVFETGGDVYVTPSGTMQTVHVSLLELGIGDASVFAGVGATDASGAGGIGVSLTHVTLGIALMKEIGGSGRSYYALSASGGATLIGVPGITLNGTVQVQVNSASTGPAVDFTQLAAGKLSIPTAAGTSAPTVDLAFTGQLLQVSGSLTLSIDHFASISGSFAFQQGGSVDVTTEGGGTGSTTALEIGASNASAFFGVGADNPSAPGAMGLSITNVTFGLALLKATAPIDGATSFVALKASGNVALVGITGITASITNASVSVNEAYDAGGNVIAQAVNFSGHNLSIATGGAPVVLDFSGTTFEAQGTIAIAIGSFVYVSGTVAFTKGTTLSGAHIAGGGVAPDLSVMTIGATGASAFFGVGAHDSSGAGGIGLSLTDVDFGLALLKPADGSAGSYYALKANVGSVGLVGVPGVTVSASGVTFAINGSDQAGVALDFTGHTLSIPTGGTPVTIDFTGSLLQASGTITLGIAGASLTAFMTFQETTDSSGPVIDISVSSISATLGSLSTGTLPAVGLLEIGHGGIAGSLTITGLHFSVGNTSSFGASFTSDATLAFNTSSVAVNTTINSFPLSVPAGSFFSITLTNAELDLYVGSSTPYQLGGTFAIQVQNGTTIIAATGVHIMFGYSGIGTVTLTNGQGAIVIGSSGVAGVLTGDFAGNLTSLGASANAQVSLSFNTSQTAAVNQTVTLAGHSITVNVAAGAWLLGLTNATVSFGGFLTLSGNFAFGSGANGSTVYGANDVEVFFGDGPYRLADGSVNPDAIGILVDDGFVGAVKESDGTFAIYAQGHAQLVGLDGLKVDGLVTIKVNQTGRAVIDQIPTPLGADPMPLMPFTTGAYTETVTGDLTLSAAGVFTVGGTFAFTLQPSGRVDVDIPSAHVDINVPINGVMTEVFGLRGDAKFSFGGGLGFQLQRLTLDGVTILGHDLDLGISTGPALPPTAELVLPYAGQDIDVATLNTNGYIEVQYTDNSGAGLNVASITDSDNEIALTGAAAAGVTLHGAGIQVDPVNNPGLFKYTFDGHFVTTDSDPYHQVGVEFLAGSFSDAHGTTSTASHAQFFLFGTSDPVVPTAQLGSPLNGASIALDAFQARQYVDVTFAGDGTITGVSSSTITVTDNGTTLTVGAPTQLSASTWRFALTGTVAAGTVVVNFAAGGWTLTDAGGSHPGESGTASFTITQSNADGGSTSSPFTLGPLSVTGGSITLADTSFSKGKLTLTIAIGLDSATLDFGGASASLTGIVGTFDIQIDLLQALQAINNPSALLSAFSVPGAFTLKVASLNVTVPGALLVTATQINVAYNPNQDQSYTSGHPLVTVGTASITFPSFAGVGGNVSGLKVYSNGFSVDSAGIHVAPAGGINLLNLLVFNDLEVDIDHFGVSIDSGTVNFHGGVGGTSGITVKSSGVQFLPGKTVNGSITDGPDADHWAVTATFQFDSSGFKAFVFNADQLTINLGSFLQLTASNFSINTGAGPSDPLVSFGSAGATINVAGLTISGSATSFAFLGDGSFRAGTNFGVTLSVGSADGSSFAWPSWLPIRIDSIGIQWPNINTDPTNFLLTLSADVTGIKGIDGLEFSGSIQGIQIDIGKLLAGEFPIVGISSIGVEVKGNLFGGQIDAELIGGIVKLDASGNMIADTDTTTPVASRVFFAGLSGSFSMAGIGGFSIQLALSELGPLSVVIGVTLPTGITLDPDTGLTINDFVGGVQFFQTLPSLDDPMELRNLTLPTPGATPPDQWLTQVKQQVVNQYKASLAHPGQNGWAAAFTSPMLIIGSATVYSIYTSQELFNGQVTIAISTDGKFLVIGKLNFAANNLSVSGRLYADLSNISQGAATVLFLADVPDQVRVLTLYGKLQMGFKNIQGQEVTFTVPDLPPNIPTATLGGPADGATIAASELNGRGYVDVTYIVPTGQKLDDASITDLAPEFTIAVTSGHGTVKLDSSQAPIHLSGNTYRYWVLSQGTDSSTVIALTPGDGVTSDSTWALDDTTTGTTTPNPTDASAAFTFDPSGPGLRTPYIDVGLAPTSGQTVDTSTLGAGDIVFTQDGSTTGPLPITIVGSPTQIPNTDVFRYYLAGTFPDGKIDVSFPAGAWADTAMQSAAGSGSFTVVQPVASVVAPFNGPSVDVTVANGDMDLTGSGHPTTGPHYIDVVYSPPTGTSLDYGTIYTTTYPTMMIGTTPVTLGAPTGIEMVTDPTSGALVATAVSQTKAQMDNVTRFRYDFTSGSWAPGTAAITIPTWSDSGGDVAPQTTLTFEVLGPTVQLVQPTDGSGIDVNTINGRIYVDVPVTVPSYAPAGSTINWAALTSGSPIVTLSGPGIGSATIDTSQVAAIVSQTPTSGTVRYAIAGSLAASGEVYATYVAGAPPLVEDLGMVTGGTVPVEVDQGAQTIDVPFPIGSNGPANGYQVDTSSLGGFNQFTLGGDGLGTVTINPSFAPVVVGNGFTVRYHVIGALASGAGAVYATFAPGTWSVKPVNGGSSTVSDADTQNGTTELGEVISGTAAPFAIMGASGPTTIDIPFPIGTLGPTGATTYAIDPASLSADGSDELTLSGPGLGTVHIVSGTPTVIGDGFIVRYTVAGQFAATGGAVYVTFNQGRWNVVPTAGGTSAASDAVPTGPTALGPVLPVQPVPAVDGSTFAAMGATGPTTIDVRFPVGSRTPTGYAIDPSSLSADGSDELTLSGSGRGTVHIVSGTPLVVGDGFTVRYTVAGEFAAAGGAVTVTFNQGHWNVMATSGTPSSVPSDAVPGAPATLGTVTGVSLATFEQEGQALDITFAVPDGATIDADSVAGFTGVVLGGGGLGTVAFDHDYAPQVLSDGRTVAYRIKGAFASLGGDVTVAVGPGSFTYSTVAVGGGSTHTDATLGLVVDLGTVAGGDAPFIGFGADGSTTIDVRFPTGSPAAGYAIDPSSLNGSEIVLGGAGRGTAAIDHTVAPQVVGDGFVVRYHITGSFTGGDVTATLTPSWSLVPATALQESTLGAPVAIVRHSSIDVALTPTIGGTIDYAHLVLS
ncbi:MAG TPA: hypothetical protein VMS63_07420, partial [Gaiellaceae bacterium]|nr:hypothetical protein [Gaiellaceae bacterium]